MGFGGNRQILISIYYCFKVPTFFKLSVLHLNLQICHIGLAAEMMIYDGVLQLKNGKMVTQTKTNLLYMIINHPFYVLALYGNGCIMLIVVSQV